MKQANKERIDELVDRIIDASKGDKDNPSERLKRARAVLESSIDIMMDDSLELAHSIVKILWSEPEVSFGDNYDPSRRSVVASLIEHCFGERPE